MSVRILQVLFVLMERDILIVKKEYHYGPRFLKAIFNHRYLKQTFL
mgnify:CR=1